MSNLIISPSASRDLNQIADYFLEVNLEAGETLFREFNKKCQKLAMFPNMGRSYSQIRDGLRGLPLDGYIILYKDIAILNELQTPFPCPPCPPCPPCLDLK